MFIETTALAIFCSIFIAGMLKGTIGVGFQTVGIVFLTIITNLPNAITLLLIPSLVTNLWQALAGGNLFKMLRRHWLLVFTAIIMVRFGSMALKTVSLPYLSSFLGILLIFFRH